MRRPRGSLQCMCDQTQEDSSAVQEILEGYTCLIFEALADQPVVVSRERNNIREWESYIPIDPYLDQIPHQTNE